MSEKEKKVHRIGIRLSDSEYQKIKDEAESLGVNRSEYIRYQLGIDDQNFDKKLNLMDERQQRILELLEGYDLSEKALIELTEKLCEVKVAISNVGVDIRKLRPEHVHPAIYYRNNPIYEEHVRVREKLSEIGDGVALLWELQKY